MKKLVVICLLAFTFAIPASAQALTQEEVNAQLLATIQTLMQQVLALMAKLQTIEAQQSANTQTLGAIQQQVIPYPKPTSNISVSYGPITCKTTQEKFGNINSTGIDGFADVYNVTIPIVISSENGWKNGMTKLFVEGQQLAGKSYGTNSNPRVMELSQVNLPNHTHRDWTVTTEVKLQTKLDSFVDSQTLVVPPCQ